MFYRLEDEEKSDKKNDPSAAAMQEMLETRTIIIAEEISPELSRRVLSQLILLNRRSEKDPIYVYINSGGGCADSGFTIYDMLKFFKAPVYTVCSGMCASAAILIFLAAKKGKNFSLPNSRFMLHQPSTGVRGTASDIEITADEINKTRVRYNQIVADITGKTLEEVSSDADRDFWMSPAEAKKYGMVSKVITTRAQLK
jgi:ATP-dependent Clp protease, protease subunit